MKPRGVVAVVVTIVALAGFIGWRVRRTHGTSTAACPMASALGPACAACVTASCCGAIAACYSNADCIDLNDCTVQCGTDEAHTKDRARCPSECARTHPVSVPAFRAWADCAERFCEKECPRGELD